MKRSSIRVAVVYIEGTNCEDESVACFRHLGAQAEKVHLKQLTGDAPAELRRDLDDYDVLMIPGGFAAGDYVRAGTIFAARLRSRLSKDLVGFVKAGKPVFGVCNGFQVLVEAGLLPALGGVMTDEPEAVLATNDSSHYECRPSLLRMENGGSCAFTGTLERGQVVTFISAHAEGKLLFPEGREKRILKELTENDQVVFRFVDDRGRGPLQSRRERLRRAAASGALFLPPPAPRLDTAAERGPGVRRRESGLRERPSVRRKTLLIRPSPCPVR